MAQPNPTPKQRWWLYLTFTVASAGYGAWQATDGNWTQVVSAVLAAGVSELARANVTKDDDATS